MSVEPGLQASSRRLRLFAGTAKQLARAFQSADPIHVIVFGYALYIALAFAGLSLPWAQEISITWLDNLFMAVSAVTTTGLTVHDPGATYSFFGELVLLLAMQVGALGYLTVGTFIAVMLSDRMSRRREEITKTALGLPEAIDVKLLVKRVVLFTLAIEALGVALLYPLFVQAGVDKPLWSAVFHAVSAFCTAGLSLFATSFERFADQPLVLMTVASLSWLGALGFLVLSETWDVLGGKRRQLGFTSRVALIVTTLYTIVCTVVLLLAEPSIAQLPPGDRVWNALFTVVAAGTTAGFNSVPVSVLAPAVIVILYLIMMFGASPGGTSGGLKSSTLAIMAALVISTLRRRARVTLMGLEILPAKIQQATASVAFFCILAGTALFAMLSTENAPFDRVLFETVSALAGIGMSLGLTPHLTTAGQAVVIALMFIGRIGILAFGIALVTRDERNHDPEDADIML